MPNRYYGYHYYHHYYYHFYDYHYHYYLCLSNVYLRAGTTRRHVTRKHGYGHDGFKSLAMKDTESSKVPLITY